MYIWLCSNTHTQADVYTQTNTPYQSICIEYATLYPSPLTFPVLRNMKPLNNRIRNDNNTSTSVWYIGWWRLYVRCLPSVISSQHNNFSLTHCAFDTQRPLSELYSKIVEEIYCSASMLLLIHTVFSHLNDDDKERIQVFRTLKCASFDCPNIFLMANFVSSNWRN